MSIDVLISTVIHNTMKYSGVSLRKSLPRKANFKSFYFACMCGTPVFRLTEAGSPLLAAVVQASWSTGFWNSPISALSDFNIGVLGSQMCTTMQDLIWVTGDPNSVPCACVTGALLTKSSPEHLSQKLKWCRSLRFCSAAGEKGFEYPGQLAEPPGQPEVQTSSRTVASQRFYAPWRKHQQMKLLCILGQILPF